MNDSVQTWLAELEVAPRRAIHGLVLGSAGVAAWARSSLREMLVEVHKTHRDILDSAIVEWLSDHVMTLPPDETPTLVWGSHLQDLFGAVAGLPLPQVEQLLGERRHEFREWLKPLRSENGVDPEAAYLSALAWSSGNCGFEGMWRGFALRTGHEPDYYPDIGLLGLRKLRDEQGRLPSEPPPLLLATLVDMADHCPGMSKERWLRTVRALMGGYYYSLPTWKNLFKPILEAKPEAKNGPKWLAEILPDVGKGPQSQSSERFSSSSVEPIPLQQSEEIIRQVEKLGPNSPETSEFMKRHRQYAITTGDPYFLVRTFNRLAEAAIKHDPDWAVARAEEIMEWEPENVYCWMALAHALWARGLQARKFRNDEQAEKDCRQAIETLWGARYRFPADAHVRSELGKLLRYSGEDETAETVYREALEHSPDNAYVHSGLARILFLRSAVNNDESEREEARGLLQAIADQGDHYAISRLRSFDDDWRRLAMKQTADEGDEGAEEASQSIDLPPTLVSKMHPTERLGRALVRLWQARNTEDESERERLFATVEDLLSLPPELAGECHHAIIEARGFLFLARGRDVEALAYFEELREQAQPPPLSVRLGLFQSRLRCGRQLSENEAAELESFGPDGSILPLVLKVVRLIETTLDEDALCEVLLQLYPKVRDLAQMPASEVGEESDSREGMIANLLFHKVFVPAGIHEEKDLGKENAVPRLMNEFVAHRDTLFHSFEQLALAE